jgi:putative heme-binding domain-containing protein
MNWEKDTRIYRLAPNPAVSKPNQFPRKLSDTGLFTDTAAQAPAAGVLPFEIAEPMWQDGAKAALFIALPEGKSIKTTVSGNPTKPNYKVEWPAESVLARTITWPATPQRIETQILHFDGETWNGYSYRWNDKGTDAELVAADGAEFTVQKQPWRIHGRAECARCHTSWSGFALGFQPDQLVSIGGKKPAEASALFNGPFLERLPTHLVSSQDKTANLETRARSWLHANCAHCHRRHGGGSVPLMVNYDLPTAETMMLYEKPTRGDLGIKDPAVVHPLAPQRSILFHRVARTGSGHMPMIGARDPDPTGVRLLWDWISDLPTQNTPALSSIAELDRKSRSNFEDAVALLEANKPIEGADPMRWFPTPSHLMMVISSGLLAPQAREAAIKAAMASGDPNITSLFERFLPPDQRVKTLGVNFDAKKLLEVQGDARRGGELISMSGKLAACLACHIVNGIGRDFGPDLSKAGARLTREQILESLQKPSKNLAKGYETWLVTLKDGSVQSGFVTHSDEGAITLKLPTGQPQTIKRDQIKSQQPLPVSLMPEGLLQGMTEQEAADVIAFLAGLK